VNVDVKLLIVGAAQVAEHYGDWPTFHDAQVVAISVDCRAAAVEATLDLCDAEYPSERSTMISLRWEGVTHLQLTSSHLDGVLCDVAFSKIKGGTETKFVSATGGVTGQMCASQVTVTRYEPAEE